jgi:DnaD/phage-associated family protein
MDYIKETNSFYDWLETNSLSHSAVNLWHALMHINSKTGWITEFAVAISTLEVKTGLKKDALIGARHKLQQTSRIAFRSRSGQQSTVYTIIPFESFKQTQYANPVSSVGLTDANGIIRHTQVTSQLASQSTAINKDLSLSTTATDHINMDVPVFSNASLYEPTGEDDMSVSDAYFKVFNTFSMTGMMTDYIKKLKDRGCSDYLVKEILLEMGESATKPSIRYMQTTAERWIKDGITSREHSKGVRDNNETIYNLYRRKIGEVTQDRLNLYLKHFGEEMLRHAINHAVETNRKEAIEVFEILKTWEKSGVKEPWKYDGGGDYR